MGSVIQIQILDVSVCILLCTNVDEKGMNQSVLLPGHDESLWHNDKSAGLRPKSNWVRAIVVSLRSLSDKYSQEKYELPYNRLLVK